MTTLWHALTQLTPLLMVAPLLLSALLGLVAHRLGRMLPPATTVRLFSGATIVLSLACGFVLSVVAFIALAQLPLVAGIGRWSVRALSAGEPMPLLLGIACATAVAVLLASGARRGTRVVRDLVVAATACRRLRPQAGSLVVIDDDLPDAYALPGLPGAGFGGRVVVSTGMLRALPGPERSALLAHEAAHLRHHHHLYTQLAALGAASNPLMRPMVTAVHEAIERWADEEAATDVGDRTVAAHALARASLARHRALQHQRASVARPVAALAAAESAVVSRTQALLAPPPRPRRLLTIAATTLVLAAVGAAIGTAGSTEHRFELAQAAFGHQHDSHASDVVGRPHHRPAR